MTGKLSYCKQCDRPMWCTRSSKKWCSNACAQKNKRGTAPSQYWRSLSALDGYKVYDDTLSLIASESPQAFTEIQRMKNKYGHNAMLNALRIVAMLGGVK